MGLWNWVKSKAIDAAAGIAGVDRDVAHEISEHMRTRDYLAMVRSVLVMYKRRGGEMLNIRIDSAGKRMSLEVQFPDDERPLALAVDRYTLVTREDGQEALRLEQMSTSKSSYNVMLKMLPGGSVTVPLPPGYEDLIKLVL